MGLCQLWQEKVAAQEEETECVFCNETYGTQQHARTAHLGRHMIEIALLRPIPVSVQPASRLEPPLLGPSSHKLPERPQDKSINPIYRRMGLSRLAQSSPLEFAEPIGLRHHFHFTRPQSQRGYADEHSSDDSDAADFADLEEIESCETSSSEGYLEAVGVQFRMAEHGGFVLEELDDEYIDEDESFTVLRPTSNEEAEDQWPAVSSKGPDLEEPDTIHRSTTNSSTVKEDSTDEERRRAYLMKKKRWSAGIFKRSHSQSVEGGSSYSDTDPLDDDDVAARRLRRRVRGPMDRTSLISEDRGYSNRNNIAEVEEPNEGDTIHACDSPSLPADDGFTLDKLPFWEVGDDMDAESESSARCIRYSSQSRLEPQSPGLRSAYEPTNRIQHLLPPEVDAQNASVE